MPTTTDRSAVRRWSFVAYGVCAISVWFGGLAVAARAFEPTDAVIVIAGSKDAANASVRASDVALLDASDAFITVAGRSRGFVRDLYAAGAWLVLPVSGGGCRGPR
jgi:hypothetical protein